MRLINANKIDSIFWNCRSSNDLVIGLYEQILDIPIVLTIPDNATNGDMIKAMFPNVNFDDMAFTVHATTNVTSNGVKGGISYDFWKEWWNAPYNPQQNLSYTDKSCVSI